MQCTMEIADAPATRSFAHAGPDGHVSIYKLVSVPCSEMLTPARTIGYLYWAGN